MQHSLLIMLEALGGFVIVILYVGLAGRIQLNKKC